MGSSVLLTNDDGIDAPGLSALAGAVSGLFDEVWTVAPAEPASQVGHRVTTGKTIRVTTRGERGFAVAGSPADCTRLALAELLPEQPDLVVSGINFGGNLGRHDFVISGTVAAAREAVFHGVPAIAISNYHRAGEDFCWETSRKMAERVLAFLSRDPLGSGEFWNVNLPHAAPGGYGEAGIRECHLEPGPLLLEFEPEPGVGGFRYTGRYHERPAGKGSDVEACFGGDISVTRVSI